MIYYIMKILRSFSDQVIGIRSIVDHKTEIGHSSMIIIFRKQKKKKFLWLARPKNLPCNQIWWRVRESKKNHILSFDIYRIVSSSSMICRASVTTFRYLEIKNVSKHVIYMPTRRNALKYTCFSNWICKLHHDLDTDMYVCSI